MIEHLAIALTTLVTNQELSTKRREDNYVIVNKLNASSTSINNDFFAQLKGSSLTTYQSVPVIKISNDENVFISPVKHSVTVNGLFVVGGRISQPEIDEDEIVYFDE